VPTGPFQLPLALDLAAVFVFAVTGALVARHKGFDVVGVSVLALVTGLGGALLRDGLFLQAGPPIVIRDARYLLAVLAGALAGVWFANHLDRLALFFQLADAVGLGLYGAVGAQKATEAGLPADVVALVPGEGHEPAKALMRARGLVDVLVPRGGAGLIRSVVEESTVPVIETGVGNCHVYVDADADLDMALAIVLNAKTHRPSVCNAAESLLVHRDVAEDFLPRVVSALQDAGVTIHGDEAFAAFDGVVEANEEDFGEEYLSLDISAAVVPDLDAAIAHIRRYSSGHSDAIVTRSQPAARRFTASVDSAAVLVNASTRFTDGGEFGFGAEIGISTQKLHARGPMGLPEMTSTKYVVTGDGHTR